MPLHLSSHPINLTTLVVVSEFKVATRALRGAPTNPAADRVLIIADRVLIVPDGIGRDAATTTTEQPTKSFPNRSVAWA
jgi:hypothetical protein